MDPTTGPIPGTNGPHGPHGHGPNGMPLIPENVQPKAPQACVTCKKQKRKCDKVLPSCGLCSRMQRHCDYTEQTPAPTHEDINVLRMKLTELEARVNGGTIHAPPTYATPSGSMSNNGPEYMQSHLLAYADSPETPFHNIENKFPVMAVLDNEIFRNEGQVLYFRTSIPLC